MARSTDWDHNAEDRGVSKELSKWKKDLNVLTGAVSGSAPSSLDIVLRIDTLDGILRSKNPTEGAGCSAADSTSTPAGGETTVQKQATPKKQHSDSMVKRMSQVIITFF